MSEEFFLDEEVQDLAETHVGQLLKLENSEAERILRAYKRARQDLRDRLEAAPPGTFTEQQMRGTLFQVEQGIVELSRILKREMSASSLETAQLGIEHLARELSKWNKEFQGAAVPINVNAVAIATDTQNFLINRYETSISSYSEMLRQRIAFGLTDAALQQMPMSEVITKLSKTFMGEEWKLQQITRTELHNVYSTGKLNGMRDLRDSQMPDLMKTLWHPMDSRTGEDSKRLNRNNPIVPVDEPFVEDSTGKTLTYMAPPNRPNDRAILIPFRESWSQR